MRILFDLGPGLFHAFMTSIMSRSTYDNQRPSSVTILFDCSSTAKFFAYSYYKTVLLN